MEGSYLGQNGFFCLEGDQIFQAPDTTGAGDGYMGAMTARLVMGDNLVQACQYAK